MNEIIKHPASNVVTTLEAAVASIGRTMRALEGLDPQLGDGGNIREIIARIRAWATSTEHDTLRRTIEQGVMQATEREVREHLFVLVHAFPNAANQDLTGYGALLATNVLAERASRYGIAKAVTTLIRTCRYVPSIAETLDAISDAEERARQARRRMTELPVEIEQRSVRLMEALQRHERMREDERKRQREGREAWR